MATNPLAQAKQGRLEMGFEVDSRGHTILRHLHRKVPIVVQQALYFDEQLPTLPCVYILSSGGPYVDGDRYEQTISLGDNAMAHISTGAATKVATMYKDHCRLTQHISLGAKSYLEWLPLPTIPHRGARLVSHTEVELHPTASLFYAESYTSGRTHHGEEFDYDYIDSSLTVAHKRKQGCEPFMRERMRVEPHLLSPQRLGTMGGYRHYATALMLAPQEVTLQLYEALAPKIEPEVAVSVALLGNDAGVVVRLLCRESQLLRQKLRSLCSLFRQHIKGCPLPDEFPWR